MKKVLGVICVLAVLSVATLGATAQTNDAWIPGLASFVLPGLGQFINDQVDKAILHFGVAVALDVGAYYVAALLPLPYYTYPLVGLVHLGWGIYSGLDAYNVAKDKGFSIGLVPNGIAFQMDF